MVRTRRAARDTGSCVSFSTAMLTEMSSDRSWRGHTFAGTDGCHAHHLPTNGPNLFGLQPVEETRIRGTIRLQWPAGFKAETDGDPAELLHGCPV